MRRPLVPLALAFGAIGCGTILGIDEYEPVDCVRDCTVDAATADASTEDSPANATDAPTATDAGPCILEPCAPTDAGARARISVTTRGSSSRVTSSPSGLDVPANSSGTGCFVVGDRLRLELSSRGTWSNVACEDGPTTDRCEFRPQGPTCVSVTTD